MVLTHYSNYTWVLFRVLTHNLWVIQVTMFEWRSVKEKVDGPKVVQVEFHDRPVSWSSSFSTVQFWIVLFHSHSISRPSNFRPPVLWSSTFMTIQFYDCSVSEPPVSRPFSSMTVQYNDRPVSWRASFTTIQFNNRSFSWPVQHQTLLCLILSDCTDVQALKMRSSLWDSKRLEIIIQSPLRINI